MKSLIILAAGGALYATLAGCSLSGAGAGSEARSSALDVARVEVINNNWSDVVIYANRNGTRIRLGLVTSMNTEVLKIPSHIASEGAGFHLVVRPIGSNSAYQTEPVRVIPGQTVEFRVENHLSISSISIWAQ